ncbi:unnamed protein product [Fraxinus pennsylvanica]|uniref:RNase H type-1 domain-containing protein n=1 Tax=Fraxinus pennsylvanica TaxID=56036 RepID=A0AAD1YU23_9LAMI|nr:unnamed protein product [Fraxinus pennsylvanica]
MEGKYESVEEAITTIKFWLQQMASSINKVKVLSSHDARILSNLNIPCVMGWQRQTRMITWRKPISGRVKLNVNGCSFWKPGPSGCGGVIRDEFGMVMAGFTSQLGETTNTEAELRAIIEGLKVYQQLGACALEFECDSLIIVNWLKKPEGNQVADSLAKLGAKGHT